MTANEIRDSFKKFFESKGHTIVQIGRASCRERV